MLRLSYGDYAALRAHGEETYPNECCGILLGTRTDSAHNRYHISPIELIQAQRVGRESGLDIIGFYHSHPDHPARWSQTDFAEAHWMGCSYVITAVEQGQAAVTNSFRLTGTSEDDKSFADEAIEISVQGADGEVAGVLEMEGEKA